MSSKSEREDRLDRLIRFDFNLIDSVGKVASKVQKFKSEVTDRKFTEAKTRIQELMTTVDELEETFNKRKNAILNVIEE